MSSNRGKIRADTYGAGKQLPANRDKPDRWKTDISKSVDLYNAWFLQFAPRAFRETRSKTAISVEIALKATRNLTNISPEIIRRHPGILPALRMSTCPPLARDRLIGLAGLSKSMVGRMEKEGKLPMHLGGVNLDRELRKIGGIIEKLVDRDIFPWLDDKESPSRADVRRAATIVADRLCGATADPIVRNAQEERQLKTIGSWLRRHGYKPLPSGKAIKFNGMPPGTYAFRMNVPVKIVNSNQGVNIPVDVVVMPMSAKRGHLPLLIEAKSAGDFTNVNKRRKEEAKKIEQMRATYGENVRYILFLCGYFDSGYLGYEAAEGIDWVWEHRINDPEIFGL